MVRKMQGKKHFILKEIPPITPLFIRISEDTDALTALADPSGKQFITAQLPDKNTSLLISPVRCAVRNAHILLSQSIPLVIKHFRYG